MGCKRIREGNRSDARGIHKARTKGSPGDALRHAVMYKERMGDAQKMQEDEQVMHKGCLGDAWRMHEAHKGDSKERNTQWRIRGH